MEELEHCTIQAMADPAELCSVLHLECMRGEFRASELQDTIHGQVVVLIPHALPHETRSEEITGVTAQ